VGVTVRIHLIRHACPAGAGSFLGTSDPPLRELPQRSDLQVSTVFTSPLQRARHSAAALFPWHRAIVLNELSELGFGEWTGLTWTEIERRDPGLAAEKVANWFGIPAPGGECFDTARLRAEAALRRLRRAEPPVAVVAHSGINAVLWQLLTGSPAGAFQQDYLEVKSHELVG
jgi:probable phosphoglycerate mutase